MKNFIALVLLLMTAPAWGAMTVPPTAAEKQFLSKNLMPNPGAESGKAGYTNSGGTFSIATTAANVGFGQRAFQYDPSASGQFFQTPSVAIPPGLFGNPCYGSFWGKGFDSNMSYALMNGSATIAMGVFAPTTEFRFYETPLLSACPNTGNLSLKFFSTGNAAVGYVDDIYIGPALNLTNVSQASFVGGMEMAGAGSCAFSENSSSGMTNFIDLGTGSGCNAWTATSNGPGVISAQATNDHRLVFADMVPGNYTFELSGLFYQGNSVAQACVFRLSDGTNTYQSQGANVGSGISWGTPSLRFHVSVNSTATRTFKLQVADDNTGTCSWYSPAGVTASWKIYRFPTSSEIAYKPNQIPFLWRGRHQQDCGWSTSSTSYVSPVGDATCTFTQDHNVNFGTVTSTLAGAVSLTPGIVFTPNVAGFFEICAKVQTGISATGTGGTRLNVNGTVVDASSTVHVNGTSPSTPGELCGFFQASNLSPITASVQLVALSTTTYSIAGHATYTPNESVTWKIKNLTQLAQTPPIIVSSIPVVIAKEVRAQNTVSNPAVVSTTWTALGLNTIEGDGYLASLGNTTITLQPGKYKVDGAVAFSVPTGATANFCKTRIYNVTSSSVLAYGSNSKVGNDGGGAWHYVNESTMNSIFSLGSTSDLVVQAASASGNCNFLGAANASGATETYGQYSFMRIGSP